ncbi:MAG: AEC family transporter [Intestinibacillus sp.]
METMVLLIVKILLVMGFGFVVRKYGLLPDTVEQGLSRLLLSAILPLSILASGDVTLTKALAGNLRMAALATAGYYIVAILLFSRLSRLLPVHRDKKRMLVILSVFANTGFLGFPLMDALFGAEGMLYAVIYNLGFQLAFFTWGIAGLSNEGKLQWKSLCKMPVTLASLATMLLVLTPLRLPALLQDTASSIGGMTTPLSLLLIGSSFTRMRVRELLCDRWSYLVSALRLIVLPLILLAVLLACGVSGVAGAACVMITALPCAAINAIYAEQYQVEPVFAARAVIQSTLLMLVTFPLLLLLVRMVML